MEIELPEIAEARVKRFKELYESQTEVREGRLAEIESVGVLGAAGLQTAVKRVAHLTVAEGRRVEAISGGTDLAGVNFLDYGRAAADCVCRILVDGAAMGSGFMIAPGVVMTNQHVIHDSEEAGNTLLEFGYEFGFDDIKASRRKFKVDLSKPFAISGEDDLDFAIFAITGEGVDSLGWLPLEPRTDKILEGEPVVIVQHPNGREKELCLFNSELVQRVQAFLHYTTDTEPGSSGSPVFNRQWQVVALHHASLTLPIQHRGSAVVANEGIRISKIIDAIKNGKTEKGNSVDGDGPALHRLITDPDVIRNGRPVRGKQAVVVEAVREISTEGTKTAVKARPEADLDGRDGHNVDFLGHGISVPHPEMPEWIQADLAPRKDGQGFELKYRHYSVVMSKSRKLARYTVVNIDGGKQRKIKIDRKLRDWKNLAAPQLEAAADKWWYDPRIDLQYQLGPKVYDATKFAFGHLVRREDPVWGNEDWEAVQGNDDSFYMTNCSPQHEDFNSKAWLRLENGILSSARNSGRKYVVFTGPVLRFDDPVILGVKCPVAFWKVVAYEENGQLVSYGFMQWQTKFVDDIADAVKKESLVLDKIQDFQVSIAEIATATSLDFGPLLNADRGEATLALTESRLKEIFPGAEFEA